jgi:hypothetical protein
MGMGQRRLPLCIPADLYERLAAKAKAEDRDPLQQARAILRRALDEPAAISAPGEATARD